jgi:two-component system chemotaxis response regulator CheB
MTVKVLIVDDSAFMRKTLHMLLSQSCDIDVVGTAADVYEAREKIKAFQPDVLTLDIEMPKMNGLAFLERLMKLRPMPVVMVSSLTSRSAEATLLALELGAVEAVFKPVNCTMESLSQLSKEICTKIQHAAKTNVNNRIGPSTPLSFGQERLLKQQAHLQDTQLIAIAGSTGGVEAFHILLSELALPMPPIVIVQHMPEGFTTRFAERLNTQLAFDVREAKNGEILKANAVRIAPGDRHMFIRRDGANLITCLHDEQPVCGHRPSADILLSSIADTVEDKALGILLTGMGYDGAQGLLAMKLKNAITLVQDEQSCLVYGMPRAAKEIGAVCSELSLYGIAETLNNVSQSNIKVA